MIYTLELSIPKNTAKDSSVHQSLQVCKGLIYRVEFQFPAGCAALAYLAVFDGGHQLYPSSLGQFFHTDNYTIAFEDTQLKLVEPYQLDFYGYNLDDTYDHTIYCRIGMVDKEIYMARFLPEMGYKSLLALIRAEEEKQKEESKAVLTEPFPWLKR